MMRTAMPPTTRHHLTGSGVSDHCEQRSGTIGFNAAECFATRGDSGQDLAVRSSIPIVLRLLGLRDDSGEPHRKLNAFLALCKC